MNTGSPENWWIRLDSGPRRTTLDIWRAIVGRARLIKHKYLRYYGALCSEVAERTVWGILWWQILNSDICVFASWAFCSHQNILPETTRCSLDLRARVHTCQFYHIKRSKMRCVVPPCMCVLEHMHLLIGKSVSPKKKKKSLVIPFTIGLLYLAVWVY